MLITLSKVTTPIIGWISALLGLLMNGIYNLFSMMGTQKVGFTIFIYTIIVYMIMLPIQIRTQKQSKMTAYMQPEISKVQKKYQGRRDQESMQRMQAETSEVYAKYGFSPYGTCAPMAIQMVLLIGVYQVIYHIPGYVTKIGTIFHTLADKIATSNLGAMAQFIADNKVRVQFRGDLTATNIVDALYLLKPSQWTALASDPAFGSMSNEIANVAEKVQHVNGFLGMNISMSPIDIIKESFTTHAWGFLIISIAIPVIAWFTQWIGIKLTPQQVNNDNSQMGNTMKSMNLVMPLFSAFICSTLPLGVGIYWIAGAVLRAIQMVFINRSMMKIDMEELIAKNIEKAAKKKAKKPNAVDPKNAVEKSSLSRTASMSTKHVKSSATEGKERTYYESSNPDSMFNKVNMVNKYNDAHSNGKKKKK